MTIKSITLSNQWIKLRIYNFSTSIFYKYAASSSIFIHETVEANDEEDKVYVMVAVRADKELAAGTVVSIGFSVQFAGEEKGSKVSKLLFSILLSKQQSFIWI